MAKKLIKKAKALKKMAKRASTGRAEAASKKVPRRSGDVLVTQKMLSETKSELKSDITSVRLEVRAVDKKIDSLRFEMDSRFAQVDSRFAQIDSKLETMIAAIHRTNALVEEQNSRNRVVLDGYDQLYRKQEELDDRLKVVEKTDL